MNSSGGPWCDQTIRLPLLIQRSENVSFIFAFTKIADYQTQTYLKGDTPNIWDEMSVHELAVYYILTDSPEIISHYVSVLQTELFVFVPELLYSCMNLTPVLMRHSFHPFADCTCYGNFKFSLCSYNYLTAFVFFND